MNVAMRVKIGDTWYEATADCPVMVEFTQQEKDLVRDMPESLFKLAFFVDRERYTEAEMEAWMREGAIDGV